LIGNGDLGVPEDGEGALPREEASCPPMTGGESPIPPGSSEAPSRRSDRGHRGLLGTVIEIVVIVAAAFAIAMLVQAFLVKPFTIPSVSMQPTLLVGDRVLVNRLTYHFRDPKRGDVVVFRSPLKAEDLIKRIVAVGGDTVEVKDGALYVNGQRQVEPQLLDQNILGVFPATKIPEGDMFVMGDNRNDSGDSRVFGPVSVKTIVGRAFCVYWPIGHWRGL
jgi:signal peptidase I